MCRRMESNSGHYFIMKHVCDINVQTSVAICLYLRSYNIKTMHHSSMDWHCFHVIDVRCYMETYNSFNPGHVTVIPMLLNVGDFNMG
jgi:hypothetical protein